MPADELTCLILHYIGYMQCRGTPFNHWLVVYSCDEHQMLPVLASLLTDVAILLHDSRNVHLGKGGSDKVPHAWKEKPPIKSASAAISTPNEHFDYTLKASLWSLCSVSPSLDSNSIPTCASVAHHQATIRHFCPDLGGCVTVEL